MCRFNNIFSFNMRNPFYMQCIALLFAIVILSHTCISLKNINKYSKSITINMMSYNTQIETKYIKPVKVS